MSRQLRDLTIETLDALPDPCRACLFWESADAPRGPADGGRAAKEAWVQAVTLDWGPPGKVLVLDGQPMAYGIVAPGELLAGSRRLAHPISEDALLLATLWVEPSARQAGLARVLLQALLRTAHERGSRALEAYGARGEGAVGTCVLPVDFLLANGFSVLVDDVRYPLLRLDLRQTARWQESVSQALDAVLGVLRSRRRAPAPARSASA